MNSTSAPITDLDHMLNMVFFNHWAAIARGEQDATIYDMEEPIVFGTPNSVIVKSPANNAVNVPLGQVIKWSNSFGTDVYQLQVAKDTGFTNVVVDSSLGRINAKVPLEENTEYFVRVSASNNAGTSPWSTTTKFKTVDINHAPIISRALRDTTSAEDIAEVILSTDVKQNITDTDGDNLTYSASGATELGITLSGDTLKLKPLKDFYGSNKMVILTGTDAGGLSKSDTTYVTITPVNDAPSSFSFTSVVPDTARYKNTTAVVSWNPSTDVDNDTVWYIINRHGVKRSDPTKTTDTSVTTKDTMWTIPTSTLDSGFNYTFTGKATDKTDTTAATNIATLITTDIMTGVKIDNPKIPTDYFVSQNFPNPFNPATKVRYSIPRRSTVKFEVYNMLGQLVKEYDEGVQDAGTYEDTFKMNGLSSGIYLLRMTAGDFVSHRRIILLK